MRTILRWMFGARDRKVRERAILTLAQMDARDRGKPKTLREFQDAERSEAERDHGPASDYVAVLTRCHRIESEHVAYSERSAVQ